MDEDGGVLGWGGFTSFENLTTHCLIMGNKILINEKPETMQFRLGLGE